MDSEDYINLVWQKQNNKKIQLNKLMAPKGGRFAAKFLFQTSLFKSFFSLSLFLFQEEE